MTNDVNSFILRCLIAGEISLTLQEIALIGHKVLTQTLSISFISESRLGVSGRGRSTVRNNFTFKVKQLGIYHLTHRSENTVWFLHLGDILKAL